MVVFVIQKRQIGFSLMDISKTENQVCNRDKWERERERERENLGQWFVATKSGFREREREREDSENWKKKKFVLWKEQGGVGTEWV